VRLRSSNERGVVLALWALLMVLFIGIGGLAVDAGMLYMNRYYLTEAASAGAMAVMKFRAARGWTALHDPNAPAGDLSSMSDAQVEQINQIGREAALINFRINHGVPATQVTTDESNGFLRFIFNYDLERDAVIVDAEYDAYTIFVGAVSSMGLPVGCNTVERAPSRCRIVAPGPPIMRLDPAVVELVVDASGSMGEKDGGAQTRMERLQTAINDFVNRFNPNQDFVGVTAFQNVAIQIAPLRLLKDNLAGLTLPMLQTRLQAGGNTNITDGLIAAYQKIQGLQAANPDLASRPFSVVVFTDGAPNVSRVTWSNRVDRPLASQVDLINLAEANETTWASYAASWLRCLTDPQTLNTELKRTNQDNDWFFYRNEQISASGTERTRPGFVHISSRAEMKDFRFERLSISNAPSCVEPVLDGTTNQPLKEQSTVPQPERNKVINADLPSQVYLLDNFDFTLPGITTAGGTQIAGVTQLPRSNAPTPAISVAPTDNKLPGLGSVKEVVAPVKGYQSAPAVDQTSLAFRHAYSDQIAYYSAIEAADALRRIGWNAERNIGTGRIYTIGLGDPVTRNCNNPLQGSGEWIKLKPFFLERLSLSIDDMFDASNALRDTHNFGLVRAISPVQCSGTNEDGDRIMVGYEPITPAPWSVAGFNPETMRDQAGFFIHVANAADSAMLGRAFGSVATEILLRLVG
jgi:hypothetical protein